MTTRLKKQFAEKKAISSELFFEQFCNKREIMCHKMDALDNHILREKFLDNDKGKCPDYRCQKDEKEIFVEIKTLTNITNKNREDIIEQNIKNIKAKGLSGGVTSEVFNPVIEMEGPITTMLKDASSKFKNIKDIFNSPRILLLNGIFFDITSTVHEIFLGEYLAYKKEDNKLICVGFKKKKRGLFDATGSNVSAVVCWDNESNCFYGIENPKAIFPLSEDIFNFFFDELEV